MRMVTCLPIEAIKVAPNRQRREHDEVRHQELIASIQANGLLHAIVVRDGGVLVAGERRLRAIKEIYELGGTIRYDNLDVVAPGVPCTTLGQLDPLSAEEAELEENLRRVDLSWQEQAEAESRLLTLRRAQALASGKPAPNIAEVAQELDVYTRDITTSVNLAANLHRPEVRSAKTAREAVKILKRSIETEKNEKVAAILGKDFLGEKHKVFNADCITTLQSIILDEEGDRFDVVCMDPPYGMGADEFGDSGGGAAGAHFYQDDEKTLYNILLAIPDLLSAVTNPDAHAYIFCDFDGFHAWKSAMTVAGWTVFRTPLIWYKPSAFRAPWPEKGPQRKYECILYAVKGNLKCTKLGGDVLTYQPDENLGHPAQKPVELIKDLLSRSVRAGMKVLDPFCGTGPVFPAAHALSAIATGIELDPAAYAIAVKRVQQLKETK